MKARYALIISILLAALPCALGSHAVERPNEAGMAVVRQTPGLVAFWTFDEEPGQPRASTGTKQRHPLREVNGKIPRVAGGPFSGYAAELDGRHYFIIPHAETGDLNISGPEAQVSMFAVVRVVNVERSRTIAGMWQEGAGAKDDSGTRQYAMLMHMSTYGGPRRLVPHISAEGGVTRRADGSAFPWCADYAVTRGEVPEEEWCTLAFTYDGKYIRAYINGTFEERALDPVKDRRNDRYFTQEGPGGGDRGMNPYYHGRGIFRYDPVQHAQTKPGGGADFTVGARYAVGSMLKESTIGRFGGLAVFNRALSHAEIKALHDASRVEELNEAETVLGRGLRVRNLGRSYTPDPNQVVIQQAKHTRGGNTSVRNNAETQLEWKADGYFQRNRDLGQVFTPEKDFQLQSIILRTGPEDRAVLANTPGARVFVQFFEVKGEPQIHDNNTPPGTPPTHGFSKRIHRCDDYLIGVEYVPLRTITGGHFPFIPPTRDQAGQPNGNTNGFLTFMRWQFQEGARMEFKAGKRYAFMVGFEEPGQEFGFTLANLNAAGSMAPPSLTDTNDVYHGGWGIRREGDGTVPPFLVPGVQPPSDPQVLARLRRESLFATGPQRHELSPTTDGYPDVCTYRDLVFFLEAAPPKSP